MPESQVASRYDREQAASHVHLTEFAEPPGLAAGVQLMGPLPASGFEQRQGLVQREGRFIQVTDLLYHVLEQIDGCRTADEIAERITDSTEWFITADQVRHLVSAKLVPLGLIAGEREPSDRNTDRTASSSPLAVYMRMKTIGPRLIDPIARILQVFFWPPVLIPMLVCASAAHWWLYRFHGVGKSIESTLTTPGGVPLVIAIVIVSALFHEFGHAAALRFGGGQVRGMGVGLYIIYPAFYTDVTDAYRLGRWARVRTDLGGVYFNAISCAALVVLSYFTRMESLLFAVVLINIEMLRQLIPFVRLDGYWLLADLTGIPDLFSQMQPFLRSISPVRLTSGANLPKLRPWVALTFAAYILSVIPALGYLLFLMLENLPSFLERTAAALWHQGVALAATVRSGESATSLLLILTVLLLAASMVGTGYILATGVGAPIKAAWIWSRAHSSRRAAVATAIMALAGLFGFLWYPDLSRMYVMGTAPTPAREGARLLRTASAATGKIVSVRAGLEGRLGQDPFTGTIVLKRPNLARVEVHSHAGLGEFAVISDGQHLNTFFPSEKRYIQSLPGHDGGNIRTYIADQIEYFFRPQAITDILRTGPVSSAGSLTSGGVTYDLVEQISAPSPRRTVRLSIGRLDHLIHGIHITTEYPDGTSTVTWAQLKDVAVDSNIDASAFVWRPPAGSGQLSLPPGIMLPAPRLAGGTQ